MLYVEVQERFGSSAAMTAWVGGAQAAVRMLASKLTSIICSSSFPKERLFSAMVS